MSIPRRVFTVGMALALCAGEASAQTPAPTPPTTTTAAEKVFPFEIHEKKLGNGLTVIVVPMPGSGLASVRTVVRTGSRDE